MPDPTNATAAGAANSEPRPAAVPVAEALRLSTLYTKTGVVICAADRERGTIDVVTFGRDAEDKVWTADVGDRLKALLTGE